MGGENEVGKGKLGGMVKLGGEEKTRWGGEN